MSRRSLTRIAHTLRGRTGRVIVLSSPSGGGKTTLMRQLLRRLHGLTRSTSMTTRARRPGERKGAAYHFVTQRIFQRARARHALLEWARVHGQYYGTPRQPVERALRRGRDVVLVIDTQGAAQVQRRQPTCVRIFLVPPSWTTLRRRLRQRGTDDARTIARRLRVAQHEVRQAQDYDYVVINDQLQRAVHDLTAIITAERQRVRRRP